MSILIGFIVGAATGILSGYGIGGGTLLILYLTAVTSLPQRTAQGINLLYFIACAPPSLYYHIKNGIIKIRPSLYAAAAGILTSAGAAYLASLVNVSLLRRLFGLMLICIGIKDLMARPLKKKD